MHSLVGPGLGSSGAQRCPMRSVFDAREELATIAPTISVFALIDSKLPDRSTPSPSTVSATKMIIKIPILLLLRYHGNTVMVVYMYSGQRRSAGSAQVSGEQVPEMDGSHGIYTSKVLDRFLYK